MTHIYTPPLTQWTIAMTEYELTIARQAFAKALAAGAPGLSDTIRNVIASSAIVRIRGQLNLPAPRLDTTNKTAERAP